MKNNRLKKSSAGIFSLAVLSLGLGISCLANSSPAIRVRAEGEFDPSDYEHLSNANFVAAVRDCTGTNLSRRYSVQFQSLAISAFKSQRGEVFSVIDDPNYSSMKTDPFVDPTTPAGSDLNGYVYTAKSASGTKNKKLYFHSYVKYGTFFRIVNSKIGTNCMTGSDPYSGLETIYICETIKEIETDAFRNVPSTVSIQIASQESEMTLHPNWTDCDPSRISFGVPLSEDEKSEDTCRTNTEETFGEAKEYILGYQGIESEGIGRYPLMMRYTRINADHSESPNQIIEIPKKHLTNPYDAVGSTIGALTNSFNITVDLQYGESIKEDSVEFYNIFEAKKKYNDTTSAWPTETMDDVLNNYKLSTDIYPSLPGDKFTYQEYEKDVDKYLTIACHFESDAEAQAMIDSYVALLDEKVDEDGEKLFNIDTSFDNTKYGDVYRQDLITDDNEHYAIFVQLYTYQSHFISYFVIDHLVQKFDEEGNPVIDDHGTPDDPSDDTPVYEYSRTLPISTKKAAVRPYKWVPDINEETKVGFYYSSSSKRYSSITYIDNIFNLKYTSSSKFAGYTSIGMNITKKFVTAYGANPLKGGIPDVKKNLVLLYNEEDGKYYNGTTAYTESQLSMLGTFEAPLEYVKNSTTRKWVETNLLNVISGKIYFRYVIKDLNSAKLVVKYLKSNQEFTKKVDIKSPNPVIELGSVSNNLKFLVNSKDIDFVGSDNILSLGITEATINIHLFNSETKTIVKNTDFLKLFGHIEILPYSGNKLSAFNADLFLILFVVIFTGAYGVAAFLLFLYQKNKFKNDEFRRVKPKQFVKTALASYLGLMLIALAINFIVLRFALFYSSVPVFNPADPFVIAFGVAGAISIGLFIRMFVIMHKQRKAAKETKRLHLDKDVVDDGTK